MKKKFLTLLLALMVALALTVPAWAEQQPGDAFVYDMAGLLSEEDDAYLEALASQISWEHNCAVYIVTMEDHQEYDSDIHYAVVSFYDSNSLGIGENREGILLMLSMYDRSYDLYVRDGGIAQYAVSDYGRHKMTDVFLDNFGEDDWRGGFEDYLFACDEYLTLAEQGTPVKKSLASSLLPGLAIGIAVALVICLSLKGMMKSVRRSARADIYVTEEGLNLTEQVDRYTHTTETRRKIEKDHDSGSSDHSGGGGSSTSGHFYKGHMQKETPKGLFFAR